jgi:hypothetical protein
VLLEGNFCTLLRPAPFRTLPEEEPPLIIVPEPCSVREEENPLPEPSDDISRPGFIYVGPKERTSGDTFSGRWFVEYSRLALLMMSAGFQAKVGIFIGGDGDLPPRPSPSPILMPSPMPILPDPPGEETKEDAIALLPCSSFIFFKLPPGPIFMPIPMLMFIPNPVAKAAERVVLTAAIDGEVATAVEEGRAVGDINPLPPMIFPEAVGDRRLAPPAVVATVAVGDKSPAEEVVTPRAVGERMLCLVERREAAFPPTPPTVSPFFRSAAAAAAAVSMMALFSAAVGVALRTVFSAYVWEM